MLINPDVSQAVALIVTVFALMRMGLELSGIVYVAHVLSKKIAAHTRFDPPDPTVYKRTWHRLFEQNFHPFGVKATHGYFSAPMNTVLYQLTVGSVAVLVAMGFYFLGTMATLGTMLASYQVTGAVPDMSGVIHTLAAACLLFGLAVIFYAGDQAPPINASQCSAS